MMPMPGAYAPIANVSGFPAGVVPVTRVRPDEESDRPASRDLMDRVARETERGSAGLPIAVQVIARPWRDTSRSPPWRRSKPRRGSGRTIRRGRRYERRATHRCRNDARDLRCATGGVSARRRAVAAGAARRSEKLGAAIEQQRRSSRSGDLGGFRQSLASRNRTRRDISGASRRSAILYASLRLDEAEAGLGRARTCRRPRASSISRSASSASSVRGIIRSTWRSCRSSPRSRPATA
jgi:hypothetical protein